MIWGTARARACWGWALPLQIRGAVGLGILPAPLPAPCACHPACTTTTHPACFPTHTPHLHPRLGLPPCLHPLLTPGLHPCPLPGSGCEVAVVPGLPVLQRRRQPLLSAGTKEPKHRHRYGSKHGQGEAGRVRTCWQLWAQCAKVASQCAKVASLQAGGRGAGWHHPHAQGWRVPPCTPVLRSRGHVGLPG